MSYKHLKREERYVIFHLVLFGMSFREIARRLNRSTSTVTREFKGNRGDFGYWYEDAQQKSEERASASHRGRHRRPDLVFRYVEAGLCEGWSPEMISARLKVEFPREMTLKASHEAIYQWVYQDAKTGGELYRCLRRQHARRRKQRRRLRVSDIPGRLSIENRPVAVNSRRRFGDWESDTLQGASRER